MSSQDCKVAIVTGASQGISAELMTAYLELGYRVVATSRTVAASQDPNLTVQGDIADPATARRILDACLEAFGRVDTLVNNAGGFLAKPFTDYTRDDFATITGVNLAGLPPDQHG
ncbi:SDR family NAD(P)-dependent oxidoreductase [Kitasatospora griseola]|uniref:SDR family NAD(P)-dependent oxidoreductase n=1 Tax=Kitasatospora griseola TaxID=2064 RepID=UPI00382A28DA